jgi:hypothetical protein
MGGFAEFHGFDGLLGLQRDGVDVRPTLLRVLTDLYVQSPSHTPAEERYYTELALRLLEVVDISVRTAVARRLAARSDAPRAVILWLAQDVREVAEPVLLYSPCLAPADLEAIVRDCGAGHAATIARRRGSSAAREGGLGSTLPASAGTVRGSDALELCEIFYAGGSFERRLILLNLDYAATVAVIPPAAMQRGDIWRIESAVLQHSLDAVERELERTLAISSRQARRIVHDPLGEPVMVAAKALAMPADVLHRVLLLMNPAIGQSVDRVYELANLHSEITVEAARRLIGILQAADPPRKKPSPHQPLHWSGAAENARQALAEISRRIPVRLAQPLPASPPGRPRVRPLRSP